MPILRIKRAAEFINLLRNYQIYINGKKAGSVANGKTKDFIVPAGQHTVKAKIDWCSSPEISLNVEENNIEIVRVKGFKWGNWLLAYTLIVIILPILFFSSFWLQITFLLLLPVFLSFFYILVIAPGKYLILKRK